MGLPGELRVVADVPAAFADLLLELAPASVAFSGGDLARRCYEALAARECDWSAVDVFFGDERFVPPAHADSNEGMARRALLDEARPHRVHGMYRPGPIVEAAEAYDRLLRHADPIDVCHLGLGPDGHTASLFPGSPALTEEEHLCVATGDSEHPHPRLTFTYPAIERCRDVIVTVAGGDKHDALARVRAGDDLPATHLRAARRLIWLVDPAALGQTT